METQAKKQNKTVKFIYYVTLFAGSIWCTINSFCEYAGTLKTKTLIKGIFFFVLIFLFASEAIAEYKLIKAKQTDEDKK